VTTRKHSVKVEILGESYAIRTEAAPEHTRAVAHHLDRSIRQILAGGSVIEANRAAILAALQITSELFQAREASESIASAMQGLSAEVARMLPPTKRAEGVEIGIELATDIHQGPEAGADAAT
jgi:cell division protein ZapA